MRNKRIVGFVHLHHPSRSWRRGDSIFCDWRVAAGMSLFTRFSRMLLDRKLVTSATEKRRSLVGRRTALD